MLWAADVDNRCNETVENVYWPYFGDVEPPPGLVQLLRTLAVHDDRLAKVVREHRPNLFAEYLLNLATAYNSFYRDCYIIENGKVNRFYFAISELARTTLKAGMEGLGIVPLESM